LFPFYVPSPHWRAEVISNTLSVGVATRAVAGEPMVDEVVGVYAVQFQAFHPDVSHYVQAVRLVVLEYVAREFHPCLAVLNNLLTVQPHGVGCAVGEFEPDGCDAHFVLVILVVLGTGFYYPVRESVRDRLFRGHELVTFHVRLQRLDVFACGLLVYLCEFFLPT